MIKDIYILDKNLKPIGIVEDYKSCIWANRYIEIGDCEIYIRASNNNLNLLKIGYYLIREDDEMICRIKKIEIDTDAEDGNYLIVTGYDVKDLLDQRIIWDTINIDGKIELGIRQMIDEACCNPSVTDRKFLKANGEQLIYLGNIEYFQEMIDYEKEQKKSGYQRRIKGLEIMKKYSQQLSAEIDKMNDNV